MCGSKSICRQFAYFQIIILCLYFYVYRGFSKFNVGQYIHVTNIKAPHIIQQNKD
jgi:hypothetical protein